MTLRETVDYYSDLLLLQYRSKPRARANIAIYVKQVLADMLAVSLLTCFDVPVAIGPQLDTLGKYVGVPRNIGDPIPQPYFSFSDSDGTIRPNGFNDSTNPAVNAQAIFFQTLFLGSQNTDLSDIAYRLILQLKIILNANDGTLASIQAYLHEFFPGLVALTDNKDMTLTYTLTERVPVSSNVLKGYLPKPMGVGINFIVLTAQAAPVSIVHNVSSGSPHTFVGPTQQAFVAITNGIAPYTYFWEFVSEVGPGDIGHTIAVTPNAQFCAFERAFNAYGNATSIWRCTVTDSRGLVAVSNTITVSMTLNP